MHFQQSWLILLLQIVVDAVATISVQLLFKIGRYSAYTCIDCQLYCTHTLLSQSLSTCCMNTSHIQRSRIKGTKDGVYFCMKIVLKCVCVNIWITLEVTPLLVLSTSSLNEMLHRLFATYQSQLFLQYDAEGSCAFDGAHAVHSNCAGTARSVNSLRQLPTQWGHH